MKDVTVVIPAFGAAATLGQAVASVLDQAAVIVVLDGPDTEADAVLSAFEEVEVIRLPGRGGAPLARNRGLARVETDYVMFLDADDYVEGPLLASAVAAARAERADLVFGRFVFELNAGERVPTGQPYLDQTTGWKGIVKAWLDGRYTPPCAVVWRTAFVREIGGWDETLIKNQDGDLVYRALFENPRIGVASEGCGVYVQSHDLGRISLQTNSARFESDLRVLGKIRARSDPRTSPWIAELAGAYASLAAAAGRAGHDDIAEAARAVSDELGSPDKRPALAEPPGQPLRGVYIVREDRPCHRPRFEDQLGKLGSNLYERFPAVDARALPPRGDVQDIDELVRYQSHLAIIGAHGGHDGWLHVLEDDAVVSRFAAEAIGLITTGADFQRYDLLFTNVRLMVRDSQFAELRAMFDDSVELSPSGDVAAVRTVQAVALGSVDFALTTSYLVNPRAAGRLADLLAHRLERELFAPIDVALCALARERKLSMACALPFLTAPRLDFERVGEGVSERRALAADIAQSAFYADRDMAQLRAVLQHLGGAAAPSATGDLMAEAYRQMINAA